MSKKDGAEIRKLMAEGIILCKDNLGSSFRKRNVSRLFDTGIMKTLDDAYQTIYNYSITDFDRIHKLLSTMVKHKQLTKEKKENCSYLYEIDNKETLSLQQIIEFQQKVNNIVI